MCDEPLCVRFRFVPNVLGVERQRQGQIPDLQLVIHVVAQRDGPNQSVVLELKLFAGHHIRYGIDLLAFVVQAPLENSSGGAIVQLRFDAQGRSTDRLKVHVAVLIREDGIDSFGAYLLPVLPLAIKNAPVLWQSAGVLKILVLRPINLGGPNPLGLPKIVLHPFARAFTARPHEQGHLPIIRRFRHPLVVQRKQSGEAHGSRGLAGGGDGWNLHTDCVAGSWLVRLR